MYRIFSNGSAIECESPQDVAALLAALQPLAVAAPAKAKTAKTHRRKAAKPRGGAPVVASDSSEAAGRRELLRGHIAKSEVGLTTGELRARGPKMSDSDRRNALQALKVKGEIRRAGNAWVTA